MSVVITRTANPAGVSASSNVATYTGASIGTASPNRIVVVCVSSELDSTPIASCTIGGNAMTAGTQGNQGAVYARTFYLLYPTGTTADIAVTFTTNSPTSTQNHIAVYTVTDAVYSSTGADQSTDMDATDPLTTGSTTIGTGGGMIAVIGRAGGTGGQDTWSNLSEDLDVDGGAFGFSTAFSTTAGTATRTCTATTNGEDGAMSWLIFADNSSPTVALSTPADTGTTTDTTPDLVFTGTDTESNDVRYEVQVATATFADISVANLTSGSDTDGNSTASTASVSPSSNKLLLLTVVSRTGITADPNTPTATGNGLTWVAIDNLLWDTSSSSRKKTTVFRAMGASPSSGAIAIDFGGQNQTHVSWGLEEFTGMDTSGTNGSGAIVQTAKAYDDTTNESSFTVTLGAFSNSNNATFGAWGSADDTQTATAGTGFTKYSDVTISGAGDPRLTTEFRNDNDTSVDISWSGTVLEKGGIAIEIKNASVPLIDAVSGTDAGFSGSPDNTDPFTSAQAVTYTVQSALSVGTYYWRVRAIDPSGSNSYGAWATTRSFEVTAGGTTTRRYSLTTLGVG